MKCPILFWGKIRKKKTPQMHLSSAELAMKEVKDNITIYSSRYGYCPKISYNNLSNKMAHAEESVVMVYIFFIFPSRILLNKCITGRPAQTM